MDTEDMQRVVEETAMKPQSVYELRADRGAVAMAGLLAMSAMGGARRSFELATHSRQKVQVIDYRTIPPSTPTRRQRRRNRHGK